MYMICRKRHRKEGELFVVIILNYHKIFALSLWFVWSNRCHQTKWRDSFWHRAQINATPNVENPCTKHKGQISQKSVYLRMKLRNRCIFICLPKNHWFIESNDGCQNSFVYLFFVYIHSYVHFTHGACWFLHCNLNQQNASAIMNKIRRLNVASLFWNKH